QAAPPGGILATAAVRAAAGARFTWTTPAPLPVKGKQAPVLVATPQAALPPVAGPLVGRAAEWAVFTDALAAVQGGSGRVLVVQGEAGIGKSRLLAAAIAALQAAGWPVYGGAA